MASANPRPRLGRRTAYRILLHEACRAGEVREREPMLRELADALRLEESEIAPLLEQELALCRDKPRRPFEASKAMRAALRIAVAGPAVGEKEAKILSKLARALGISREDQEEMARALSADLAAGRPVEAAQTSPEHRPADAGIEPAELPSSDDYGELVRQLDAWAAPEESPAPPAPAPAATLEQPRLPRSAGGAVRGIRAPSPQSPSAAEPPAARTVPLTRPAPVHTPLAASRQGLLRAGAASCVLLALAIGLKHSSNSGGKPLQVRPRPHARIEHQAAVATPVASAPVPGAALLPGRAAARPPPSLPPGPQFLAAEAAAAAARSRELARIVTANDAIAGDASTRPTNLLRVADLAWGQNESGRALLRIARDRGDSQRLPAVLALSRHRVQDVSDTCETLARSSVQTARWAGLLGLARISGDRHRWEAEVTALKDPWAMARFLGNAGDPEAIPLLVKCLRAPEPGIRLEAVGLLAQGGSAGVGALGDHTAVDAAIELVSDSDPRVRAAALDCLGQIADRSALPFLLRMLSSPRPAERLAALRALAALGDNEAAAPMLAALSDPEVEVREGAAAALAGLDDLPVEFLAGRLKRLERGTEVRLLLAHVLLRPEHPGILKALWPLLPSLDSSERKMAAELLELLAGYRARRSEVSAGVRDALVRSGAELSDALRDAQKRIADMDRDSTDGVAALERDLSQGSDDAQVRASQLLAAVSGAGAFDRIARLARAPHPAVRRKIVAILVRLAHREELPFLRDLLYASHPQEQPLLAEGLARLGDSLASDFFAWQLQSCSGEGMERRAQRRLAAWGLARIGVPEAAGPLLKALGDTSWQVRAVAAWGLSRSVSLGVVGGPEADDVRLRLVDLLRDPRLEVQWAAGGK
ncbi:MAG: HEAT repeat domain-containing protein [Candidatus Wallbacteria bacterium]|nr:HEAT repeat domain-containing protein [Candidatus Wallbacteria bacterium]